MGSRIQKRLVPYEMVSPGFEAMYTGGKASDLGEKVKEDPELSVDEAEHVIRTWSVWPFWQQDNKADDEEIVHLNKMQEKLGPLSDKIRQVRAHVGSFVTCEIGIPMTVDELLIAIGKGELSKPSYHNGCWNCSTWWEQKSSQPGHVESMKTIHTIVTGYLAGRTREEFVEEFPFAKGFIDHTYEWLGPVADLSKVQKLLIDRMLVPFELWTETTVWQRGYDTEGDELVTRVLDNVIGENGRGAQIDAEISELTGLPEMHPCHLRIYGETLKKISDPQGQMLYRIWGRVAEGVHSVCDCHPSTFRYIENWIYGIGTGKWGIPTRKAGAQRERLGRLL